MLRIRVDGTAFLKFNNEGDVIFLKSATIDELQLASDFTTTNRQRNLRSDKKLLLKSGTERSSPTPGMYAKLFRKGKGIFFNILKVPLMVPLS